MSIQDLLREAQERFEHGGLEAGIRVVGVDLSSLLEASEDPQWDQVVQGTQHLYHGVDKKLTARGQEAHWLGLKAHGTKDAGAHEVAHRDHLTTAKKAGQMAAELRSKAATAKKDGKHADAAEHELAATRYDALQRHHSQAAQLHARHLQNMESADAYSAKVALERILAEWDDFDQAAVGKGAMTSKSRDAFDASTKASTPEQHKHAMHLHLAAAGATDSPRLKTKHIRTAMGHQRFLVHQGTTSTPRTGHVQPPKTQGKVVGEAFGQDVHDAQMSAHMAGWRAQKLRQKLAARANPPKSSPVSQHLSGPAWKYDKSVKPKVEGVLGALKRAAKGELGTAANNASEIVKGVMDGGEAGLVKAATSGKLKPVGISALQALSK